MRRLSAAAALLAAAGPALAHGGEAADGAPWRWSLVALLLLSAVLYAAGVARLWRHSRAGHGIGAGAAATFAAGWLATAAALLGPLAAWSERSFAAHMLQHEMLMLVAAPLLVAARPLPAWAWALPPIWRRRAGIALRHPGWRRTWQAASGAGGAGVLHALALWGWHVPALFTRAAAHPGWHALQHASFFGTALLFWWAALAQTRRAPGAAMALLFVTMLHSAVLGALLTLSPVAWYGSSLEDQQLGGLLMWVPSGAAYLGVALARGWHLLNARTAAAARG